MELSRQAFKTSFVACFKAILHPPSHVGFCILYLTLLDLAFLFFSILGSHLELGLFMFVKTGYK